jgi:hypothetical protein
MGEALVRTGAGPVLMSAAIAEPETAVSNATPARNILFMTTTLTPNTRQLSRSCPQSLSLR